MPGRKICACAVSCRGAFPGMYCVLCMCNVRMRVLCVCVRVACAVCVLSGIVCCVYVTCACHARVSVCV